MRVYIVFTQYNSPIAITEPKPVEAFQSSKKAKEFLKEKESRAQRNHYWIESVRLNTDSEL